MVRLDFLFINRLDWYQSRKKANAFVAFAFSVLICCLVWIFGIWLYPRTPSELRSSVSSFCTIYLFILYILHTRRKSLIQINCAICALRRKSLLQLNCAIFVCKKIERSEKVNPNRSVLLPERARAVKPRSGVQTAPLFLTIKKFHFFVYFSRIFIIL